MKYGGVLLLLVILAILACFIASVLYKTWHPQPEYEHYQGCAEMPARVAERLA